MSNEIDWGDIKRWLVKHKKLVFVFGTNDVLEIRPDLSEEQAWEVLQECDLDDDEGCPMFYHVEAIAERLFGEAPSDEHRGEDDDGLLGLIALDDEKFLQELKAIVDNLEVRTTRTSTMTARRTMWRSHTRR